MSFSRNVPVKWETVLKCFYYLNSISLVQYDKALLRSKDHNGYHTTSPS